MDRILPLVRRWAVNWLNGQDASVLDELLTDDYRLHIGDLLLEGRDAYREAVLGQLRQFPGLVLTVHDVIGSGEQAAVRFTEHGASSAADGRIAAWGGIALFSARDGRLSATRAQEDYAARRRQLRTGKPDAVEPPHPAPWDVLEQPADPKAEAAVRSWLAGETPPVEAVLLDDQVHGRPVEPLAPGGQLRIEQLFSAGPHVAFSATPADGTAPALAGLVTVADGAVVSRRSVRDRLGGERRSAGSRPTV